MNRIANDPQSTDWVDTEVEKFLAESQVKLGQDEIDAPG
jgi:hypothetical protein